ncbi:hypothetical protein [Curtobacterium flaccumfaciens]|uniref:hypothetical protein n=1 Tax=Curtobacterium flaccumfaciens TaxID=2035 RepID=UPI00112DD40E|nr:hypothetical protein [Curtobacterium flaccumfaciens]TPG09391.1 hypothetical protein EAH85_03775 [Curtobacterium flaccumfaciens]
MAENVANQIETSPDLSIDQTNAQKAIITSPEPVLQTASVPYPQNPTGPVDAPSEDQESEDTHE